MLILFLATVQNQKAKGIKKKKETMKKPNPLWAKLSQGLWDLHLF